MPTIYAISRTAYLASLSTLFFTFDTISLQDADFDLPDIEQRHNNFGTPLLYVKMCILHRPEN